MVIAVPDDGLGTCRVAHRAPAPARSNNACGRSEERRRDYAPDRVTNRLR